MLPSSAYITDSITAFYRSQNKDKSKLLQQQQQQQQLLHNHHSTHLTHTMNFPINCELNVSDKWYFITYFILPLYIIHNNNNHVLYHDMISYNILYILHYTFRSLLSLLVSVLKISEYDLSNLCIIETTLQQQQQQQQKPTNDDNANFTSYALIWRALAKNLILCKKKNMYYIYIILFFSLFQYVYYND